MPILASKDICVGCTACVNACPKHCIEIKKDSDGFAYPDVVDLSNCLKCELCEKKCPVLGEGIEVSDVSLAYAAMSLDDLVREESSSGGIFTELSKEIITQNGIVYGAAYDEHFEVRHICVDNVADLHKLRGAKYSESNLGSSFKDILQRLKNGQPVLFSGTPCQVAGLKAFVGEGFDNLFCVDFVCHGVPSPEAWKTYIEFRARRDAGGKLPYKINLRSKETGWSQYQYSNVFEYEDGNKYSVLSSQSLFMKLFVEDYISRPSCENCKFKGYNRCSDITLGDFWGIWNVAPEMDDNKGTSVVLVHSDKGRVRWTEINDKIKSIEVTLEDTSRENPSMMTASRANLNRNTMLKLIRKKNMNACLELLDRHQYSKIDRIKLKVRQLLKW